MRRSIVFSLSLATAAVVAGCQSHSGRDLYPVFFTQASTDISPAASQIIARAASDARASHASVVEVVGHAAAHGSNLSANQLLAMERSKKVADALAADGIGNARIVQIARPPANSEDGAVASRHVSIEIDP